MPDEPSPTRVFSFQQIPAQSRANTWVREDRESGSYVKLGGFGITWLCLEKVGHGDGTISQSGNDRLGTNCPVTPVGRR